MLNRKRKKKFSNSLKKQVDKCVKIGVSLQCCEECKQDSIAHEIKSYFEIDNINQRLLFKYDHEKEKLLISKKVLHHLLTLCNSVEITKNYDMELVEENDIWMKGVENDKSKSC